MRSAAIRTAATLMVALTLAEDGHVDQVERLEIEAAPTIP